MVEPIEIAPGVVLGGGELPIIAGPCVVESEELVLEVAAKVKSIGQRQTTIRNIAEEILKVQREFFDHGVSHLKPLTMAEVASVLGIHETTVSRAIANKYMQTPQGVFEMKYFFTPGFKTADGKEVSNKTIV